MEKNEVTYQQSYQHSLIRVFAKYILEKSDIT